MMLHVSDDATALQNHRGITLLRQLPSSFACLLLADSPEPERRLHHDPDCVKPFGY